MPVRPLIDALYFAATRSNQPHLLTLPVVAPSSLPIDCNFLPLSSKSSVGNGPPPTLVTYALKIPIILFSYYLEFLSPY